MIRYPCPPSHRWAALLADDLPPAEQADLNGHLELCPACQRALEDCAAHRDAWAVTARSLGHPGVTRDHALRDVIDRMKIDPESDHDAHDGAELPIDFLDPSDRPGPLGRIHQYEVLEEVGRGGMGVVLKALDPGLHRVVAIKVLAPQLAVSGTARKRFTREARAAAAVGHENVVTIHAVEEFKGLPYLVMQYIAGPSVQQRLADGGPLPVAEILRIGFQTAAGLAAAHAQGLVHRDVKPANILLENGVERVKLTDFSLARAIDDASVTQTGVVTGTPPYMAPEQARGEPLDHRADLFSLGSVLYALCTGRPPFRGQSLDVLRKVSEETPVPIRTLNPEIPAWLDAIVKKLMAKKPEDRYQSAGEVAALLERCLAHVQQPTAVPLPAGIVVNRSRRWLNFSPLSRLCGRGAGGEGLRLFSNPRTLTPGPSPAKPGEGRTFKIAVAIFLVFLLAAVLLGATILRLKTTNGTLEIMLDDPQAKVTVDGTDIVVTGVTGVQEFRLKSGDYTVHQSKDGKLEKTEIIAIKQGEKTPLRVTFEPNVENRLQLGGTVPAAISVPVPAATRAQELEAAFDAAFARARAERAAADTAEAIANDSEQKTAAGQMRASEAKVDRAKAIEAAEKAKRSQVEADIKRNLWQTEKDAVTARGPASSPNPATSDVNAKRMDLLQRMAADLETARAQKKIAEAQAANADDKVELSRALDRLEAAKAESAKLEKAIETLKASLIAKRTSLLATKGENDPAVHEIDKQIAVIDGYPLTPARVNALIQPQRTFPTAAGEVSSAVFSAKGNNLFVADRGGSVYSYSFATGKVRFTIASAKNMGSCISFLAVSPDDTYLVGVSGNSWIQLIDNGKIRRTLVGKCSPYYAVAFTADGKTLAAGGSGPDGKGGLLELWDLATGQARTVEFPVAVRSLAFAPGKANRLAVGTDGENLRIIDVPDGKEIYAIHHPGPFGALAASPDGRWLAASVGEGRVDRWSMVNDWRTAMHRGINVLIGHTGRVNTIQFSPGGNRILTASADGTAKLWDASTSKCLATIAPGTYKSGMGVAMFTPDGKSIVTAGDDGMIRIWDSTPIATIGKAATSDKVPGLSEIPIIGDLFQKRVERERSAADAARAEAEARRREAQAAEANARQPNPVSQPLRAFQAEAGGPILSAAFTRNGKVLVIAGQNRPIQNIGVVSGTATTKPRWGDSALLAMSPDGKELATVAADGVVHRWSAGPGGGEISPSLRSDIPTVGAIACGPGGKTFVIGGRSEKGGGLVALFDGHSPNANRVEFPSAVLSLAFDPGDQTRLAVGLEKGNVQVINATTGKFICTTPLAGPTNHMAFSPDGKWFAATQGDARVLIRDWNGGAVVAKIGFEADRIHSVRFSPDGKRIATASADGIARLWDVPSGKLAATFNPKAGKLYVAEFSPDGKWLATAGDDRTIRMWDLTPFEAAKQPAPVEAAPGRPGKSQLPAGRTVTEPLRSFRAARRSTRADTRYAISSAVLSPDGKQLFVAGRDEGVRAYDFATGKPLILAAPKEVGNRLIAISPDGKLFAGNRTRGEIPVCSLPSGEVLWTWNEQDGFGQVTCLAFSPDSNRLAVGTAGDADGEAIIWTTKAGKVPGMVKTKIGRPVLAVAFHPNGQLVAVGTANGMAHVLQLETEQKTGFGDLENSFAVRALSFSPDGKILAAANGNEVNLWDWAIRKYRITLRGHTDRVTNVQYSPDGKHIATASLDGTARIWVAETGKLVTTFAPKAGKLNVALFTPDGKSLVTAGEDTLVRIWDLRLAEGVRRPVADGTVPPAIPDPPTAAKPAQAPPRHESDVAGILYELRFVKAAQIAEQLKPKLSPAGEEVIDERKNTIIVRDTIANLRTLSKWVAENDNPPPKP